MSGFYSTKELQSFGKNFLFGDWREWFAFGLSRLMLQQQFSIIRVSHDVLLKEFTLFYANIATVSRKPVEMVVQEEKCNLILMLAPRR